MEADWGVEIEANDVVIRVNRLPVDRSRERFFGSRSDIFFLDRCSVTDSGLIHYEPVGGGGTHTCNSHDRGSCPFNAVVYRGNTQVWEASCLGEMQHDDGARAAARSSHIPWGVESDIVTKAVLALRNYAPGKDLSNKPTTGFHAVVLFSLACKSVRLYGFAGSSTVDGHKMSADHGIEKEHRLLTRLEAKTLNASEMNYALRMWWPYTNLTVVC